jgi:hypothetical protein
MTINFNTAPYYDDFDSSKNYHRILFKPGYAVQGRELTQSQTILQNQVTSFADNIFKQNSPISGGQVTSNFNCFYIKLQATYNNANIDVSKFSNQNIQDATGTVLAKVIAVVAATGTEGVGDPPTLIVSYKSGNHFSDNSTIFVVDSNIAAQTAISGSTGSSSVASIAQGIFYVLGNFVQVNPSTIVLDKYDNTPSLRLGLTITETVVDYIGDPSLLDPAIGASNYQAPGADRYQINLTLSTRPIALGDDSNFIELVRYTNGQANKLVDSTVYNVIDDYFAKREYETNGDYVVNNFKLTPKTNVDPTQYTLNIGKGLAYVHGYRLENLSPIEIVSPRSRTTASQNNNPVYINYGSYFYVDSVRGANSTFFDTTTNQQVDLHCVPVANVNVSSSSSYASTVVATGYIRNLSYDHNISDANTASYVYKAYVVDIQNQVLSANVVSAASSTVTLPSTYSSSNNAYLGVNISITTGTDAGDFRTITAYNGATKVATVNQNWTVTPDTSSIFALNFDTKDIETIIAANKTSYPAVINSTANINPEGKVNGLSTGNTLLENPNTPELIFQIGSPYVASLSGTSYTSQQLWRNISFTSTGSGVSAQLSYQGDYLGVIRHFGTLNSTLSSDLVKSNYIIVVTNKGSNSTINVGDIIPWTTSGRTISLNSDGSVATIAATDLTPFSATIFARVFVENADNSGHILKYKNLIKANTSTVNISGTQVNTYTFVDNTPLTSTGQVYIQNTGIVASGNKQSLYLSDVKTIVKIIDTGSPSTTPTLSMLTNAAYDVTNNFNFYNGQKDAIYDHASITLKPGAPKVKGNLLVLINYYQHTGGDGYFTLTSYLNSSMPDDYKQIIPYTSRHGVTYQPHDCIDFRPARLNAQSAFTFRYSNVGDTTKYGTFIPTDLTTFVGNYSYYLGRIDKLVLSKDNNFQIIQGSPSLTPIVPSEPDGSLVIATLTHNPYTGFLPTEAPTGTLADLSIISIKHKRYTMQDISGLDDRITNVEYYTSLNQLEQKAQALQISDAYGLNRFKNGIMTDNFSSYSTADTYNLDYYASIDTLRQQMTATQQVQNFPLKSLALAYNMGLLSSGAMLSLGYQISSDGNVNYFSLPYSTSNVITQQYASRNINVNPFSFSLNQGTLTLTPNVDNWVDSQVSPSLLITDPNLQVFQANSAALNILQAGDWKTISGTSTSTSNSVVNHGAFNGPFGTVVGYTATSTYTDLTRQQTNIVGNYTNIGNTYALNNGYVTNVSILPYMRKQEVAITSSGMLVNTQVHCFFDNVSVDTYVRNANIIELSNVSGSFSFNDVIGYYTGGTFTPTGIVLGSYSYPNSKNVRLYVAGDGTSSVYTTNGVIQNSQYNVTGQYQSNTAAGTVVSTKHRGGRVVSSTTNTVKLSGLASTVDNYYNGNTIYFLAGTSIGQSATITGYVGSTRTATISPSVTTSPSDIYSMGTFATDETGAFYGVFNLPANTFHTGQRVFRVDNSINGNANTATTSSESTFYAEGLQTTQQGIDFGASPAGAKNVFTQVNQQRIVNTSTTYSPYDPVAQTFIVYDTKFPNGLFLNSIKVFFKSKPTSLSTPVTLSIVNTSNGYPNGQTLDYSIVTLTPNQVNVSSNPQFLDPTAYTIFEFNVPVYIQPNVLYAFIVHSSSNEYVLWSASNGDTALPSSVKNLPTDPTPSTISKINGAPYVGGLFISQNSQTWTADQNQSLMFVADRCVFNTSSTPVIEYVVPTKLPQRNIIDQSINYFLNANNVSSNTTSISNSDVLVDAFNVTTTDFTPTTTSINYSYNATLAGGSAAGLTNIIPGKFGTATNDDIYLSDGKGERLLVANSNTSFALYATLSSTDSAVSPIISDAGLSVYTIKWGVNNCELSNTNIVLSNGGSGYTANTLVTISAPTGTSGTQAYASANISGGVIQSVYFTNTGSGYITTPTITITDTGGGANAVVSINGETSSGGGNALAKYVTKKVVLTPGNDSGDLNVYVTAYRPVNTNILVYYKILNRNDTQSFESGSWQLMNMINNSQTLFSTGRTDLYEFVFAPGTGNSDQGYVSYTSTTGQTYTSFSQFAIKVVLTSSDHTFVPFLNDLRVIALPSNTNTTV